METQQTEGLNPEFAAALDQPITIREMMEAGVHFGHQT
jgi:ribosomal protein S2